MARKPETSPGSSPDNPKKPKPAEHKTQHDPDAADKPAPPTEDHGKTETDPNLKPQDSPESRVDLSQPGGPTGDADDKGESPSGISQIEWAALVEDVPPSDSGTAARIDAPSDADWLKKSLDMPRDDSDSILSPAGAVSPDEGSEPNIVPGSHPETNVDEPDVLAEDLEVVRSAFAVPSSPSLEKTKRPSSDKPGDTGVQEKSASETGVVELGAELPPVHDPLAPSSPNLAGMESDVGGKMDKEPVNLAHGPDSAVGSGVDLGEKLAARAAIDSDGSGIDLFDDPSEVGRDDLGSASGRDLIAEQVESGVDLSATPRDTGEEEFESEAGQAGAAEGDPLKAGTVESDVIEGKLVEDVVHDDDGSGEAVALGQSPARQGQGSSVNLSGPAKKKRRDEAAADEELGSASGNLVSSDLDYTHVPAIEGSRTPDPDSDAVEYGSDEEIHLPDEEEKPSTPIPTKKGAQPAKQRGGSGVVGCLGGGVLGAVVATGACAALWFAGLVGGESKSVARTQPIAPVKQAASFEDKLALLRNGDFDKAGEMEQIDENNAEQLAARGEYRWLSYFKKQRLANLPIKADDEPVKLALADFDKAAAMPSAKPDAVAEALSWKGHIDETLNKVADARKTYADAAVRFAAEPMLKRRFDAARIRLDLRSPQPAGGVGQLPGEEKERLMLVALLLPLLQAGEPTPAKQDAAEAGYDFWDAVEQAHKLNFADALKKLQSARDLHDKRRVAQLRKSQNPMSDPTEEIFLHVCDELKAYWEMQEHLRGYLTSVARKDAPDVKALDGLIANAAAVGKWYETQSQKLIAEKVIAEPKDFEKGIDQLLAEHKTAAADKAKVAKLGETLVTAKVITKPDDLEQGVEKLLTERKDAEKKVADLTVVVTTTQTEAKKQKDLLTAAETKLAAADDLKKTIKKELVDAKYLEPTAGDDKVLPGFRDLVKVATTDSSKEALRKLQVELTQAKDHVSQRWQPQEMLTFWLPVLENHGPKELAEKAGMDADRVEKDAGATPAQKARAATIKGLMLRNEGKYADAKTALEKAKTGLAKDDKAFLTAADAALKEAGNPGALFLAQADALQRQGKYDDAVAALTHAVDLLPQEKGKLLAKRSLVEMEAARVKSAGKLTGSEPLLVAAQKDATAASAAGSAMGHYAAGRIAEELSDYNLAAQSYRQAITATSDPTGDGSLFRIALARVLLQMKAEKAAPKLSRRENTEGNVRSDDFVLLTTFLLQAPLGDQPANIEEAVKLADEILKLDKSKVPYEVRAQALGIKSLWTEALVTYAEGLKTSLDREHFEGLIFILDHHPKLKSPDVSRIANPLMAEAHYGAGLRHYFDGRYEDAEKEFLAAVKNESQDARYHYFLGLSRLAQRKNEAHEDFAQGAVLENKGRPSREAVSKSLERIQGPVRAIVNDARDRTH